MKIKIFSGRDINEIENSVNEFIRDKYVINIHQSESIRMNFTITVLYDDTFNCGYAKTELNKLFFNNTTRSES